ncbi:MAG: NERD domain-containing protein, partial [Lachnospiraceae bacterium]|nr:NERD domain-containing protein [Lachnospiraceae bacterium]
MKDYREIIGEEGEEQVREVLQEVLNKMDYEYKIVRNVYFPFESVYGINGYITAEFDFIVFTPFYIYIIEVKNERYLNNNPKEPLCELMDNTEVSNPITQNHNHKNVFCSEMMIQRENVITIEILLKTENCERVEKIFPNDYVFGKDDYKENLFYLLSTETDIQLDYKSLYKEFINKVEEKGISKEEHINI